MDRTFIGKPPVETPDNFANHPETVSEIKAHKSRKATDWTPRDALINMLRDIDSGKTNITDIVICFREEAKANDEREGQETGYANATHSNDVALSLLARVQYMLAKFACE